MSDVETSATLPMGDWEQPEPGLVLPPRPRRRLWTPATGLLLAVLLGAGGFLAGVELEKSRVSGGTVSLASAGGGAAARARAATGTGAGRFGAGGAFAAAAGRFGGTGAGVGGNSSFGTISSVSGHILYLTDTSGNTVKVRLSSATSLTKNQSVSSASIRPGDSVIVQGLKGSDGTITATSLSDSGNRSAAAGGGTSGSGSSASSSSSALNSLFGSGG
jgi:hypothetical protein